MKRVTLLFVLCYFVLPVKSQISFLKEINSTVFLYSPSYDPDYLYTYTEEQLCIYNAKNLNNTKNINLPFTSPAIYYLSTNLFTNSGLWEYLISKNNVMYLYNENGTQLQLIEFDGHLSSVNIIKDKLIISTYYMDANYNTSTTNYVYQLSGQKTKLSEVRESANSVYPNPATDHLNINYTISKPEKLQVYNSSGQLVDSATLEPNNDTFILGTTNYPQGHYIYKYGNVSGKFIVK